MKINFIGESEQLRNGIAELCGDLDITLSSDGIETEIEQKDGSDLLVSFNAGRAKITYDKKIHLFRALGLLAQHIKNGEREFEINEQPQFTLNGPMFDVSQGNAVITVSEIKRTLRQMALMGLNMFMVYCEDSYDVSSQPYFGYMRSRYSKSDMKECDDYAFMLGIEMIPCIQTLAHLRDTLIWPAFSSIKDTSDCLMVGEEKTYEFIRELLTEASAPFRSRRIHIGMDEAWNLGQGKYLKKNGYTPQTELMKIHLAKVMSIVRELGLKPMMWSDMFFFSNGFSYYNDDRVSQEAIDSRPADVQLVYWDYYHNDEESYKRAIERHRKFGDDPIFAGGIWTWIGYCPHWSRTFRDTDAALAACKKAGIKEVFVTIWGDNGTECPYEANVLGLALYGEHGYSREIDYNKLKERFEFITGARYDDFVALEKLDVTPGVEDCSVKAYNPSKYLMWQDIMTGMLDKNIEGLPLDDFYASLAEEYKPMCSRNGDYNGLFRLAYLVAHTLAIKSEIGLRLTAAYRSGNRNEMQNIAENVLPELRRRMSDLRLCHMELWLRLYKAIGWDVLDMRYGSLDARIDSAIREIGLYLDGKLEKLEELDEARLDFEGKPGLPRYESSHTNWFGRVFSAGRIAPEA